MFFLYLLYYSNFRIKIINCVSWDYKSQELGVDYVCLPPLFVSPCGADVCAKFRLSNVRLL